MNDVKNNLKRVHERIADAAKRCGRIPREIKLLAVSKTRSTNMIVEAITAGQYAFGENYAQEGIKKIAQLAKYREIEWHFIGPVQSNKSRLVAENFSWCHTVDCLRIAKRLNEQRPKYLPLLNVLIQVNISNESSKSGVIINTNALEELVKEILILPGLCLRGLMAIPALKQDKEYQIAIFRRMTNIFNALQKRYSKIDTLSLGMSNDMEAAIFAGSTLVRIGTDIFGLRDYR
ncbi:YggS family pyridoxal phosphate-dependent enzyme [Candidatus Pantoea carbekii]|uniref:Pyridoxal phosphate homeostasis protein n=1 Tax=Candidatus Pantoea carbekii TaxID=1235990 RepID=U3U7N3_9GAMM|nr:YggS family pyridoxal phosphate-dependent enzyme [Candidatus Pantoea carbekii]AKC32558.1 hypothetical protein BMSBPS_0790 [Candidatus Pantoea carbekii]BAO00289.1 hypothetical protein HHS_03190 [Candidatus Pantoea carbekii]